SRGVKVEIKENDCFIDLHVTVEYGSRIPEVAWEIQESVKKEVETLTGLNVVKVNIHVDGVYIPKEDAPIKSQIVSDETADEE
ncbi:MAG: Asp23/Gls24 family envelope stress response protein, partial [Clostridiaceae bacterium]|nr:Asp23/Gls24 family envelope stress response protein [Clostridiaceae bacterium]